MQLVREPLLNVHALTVAAGGRTLLRGVTLAVMKGELVGVTGPSGCGKTSLLKAIIGLEIAPEGVVHLEGNDAEVLGWPHFRRRAVYLHQRPVFIEGSVETNLRRPFQYKNSKGPFPEGRALQLLEEAGVSSARMSQSVRSLSEGEQQRVALVRALVVEPLVLLLDEPTSALDPKARNRVWKLIATEAESRGVGALIVSHDTADAQKWCHRILDLSDFSLDGV